MPAQSGIVAMWKAVSKTPTLGTPLKIFSHASMPPRLAGMCRGPNFTSFFAFAMFALVISAESVKTSPPWRMRWPMASIPFAASPRSATTCVRAAAWSLGPPQPMRSTSPLARRVSDFMSKSWYLSELEPEFTTSTFLISFCFIFSFFPFSQSTARESRTTGHEHYCSISTR